MDETSSLHEAIATCALSTYDSLPSTGKPSESHWTVLAAFLIIPPSDPITCVSLGTGLKVLPHSRLPKQGDVLHDSHAEVVARRGFRLFLFRQLGFALHGKESVLVRSEATGGWELKDGVRVGMYVSLLPSTLTATLLGLHTSRLPSLSPTVHRGRTSYSTLSTLRTKPGRIDSSPTTSHSCSDKLAMWSLVGLQGALLSLSFVEGFGTEVIVNGIRQGASPKRKGDAPLGPKARSRLSKLSAFERYASLLPLVSAESPSPSPPAPPPTTYFFAKREGAPARAYQDAKALARGLGGVLEGWLVSGEEFESFGVEGRVAQTA